MKEVLISGGAGAIGQEIVKAFINQGYKVYVMDKDRRNLAQLMSSLNSNSVVPLVLDVTSVKQVQACAQELQGVCQLDHIITLAGRALEGEWGKFVDQDLQVIHGSVDVNLLGHMNVIHSFYPHLKKKENSSILMISSINAISNYGLPSYSAAKAGLIGFMNATVDDFGADGVRINVISPGTVVTPATLKEPKDFEALFKGAALRKFVTAEEIGTAAYRVCSDFVSMTGHNLVIDAGQSKLHSK